MNKQQRNNMILVLTSQGYSPATVSAFMALNKLTTRAIQIIKRKSDDEDKTK
ncbi:hypothetical protein [Thalassomonas sp. M1454]|uniref:hypothetical protein n=1 Tax=Thalassomonas sp. M1454 TaxID=2594477 RepID=UPI00163D40D8|nr:hypothetical protein [Thalassomonas sp. M1454]